jgi:biopolymer transport protein ExbD
MRRIRRRYSQRSGIDANVDLVPMMCLLCILIPMLLVTAAFEQLAALRTHLPKASTLAGGAGEGAPAEQKTPTGIVELRVAIHDNGLRVEATVSHTPEGVEKEAYEDIYYDIPIKGQEYDLDRLRAVLVDLKRRYPRHDEVVLLVDDAIPYDTIVQTMDTCREELYAEGGKKKRTILFPNIALSEAFDESKGFEGIRKGTREIDKRLESQQR